MIKAHDGICPRCGGAIPEEGHKGEWPGAVSRWDNQTEVCSQCGLEEGLIEMMQGTYREQNSSLSPTNPDHPWWITDTAMKLLSSMSLDQIKEMLEEKE